MSAFEQDRQSGSSAVADQFLTALERWLGQDRSPSAVALREALLAWLRGAQGGQPSMALVHQLAARALAIADTAAGRKESPLDLRQSLLHSIAAEREDLARATVEAARLAAQTVAETGSFVATLSYSGAVLAALAELQSLGRSPRVLLAESRPGLEGRLMARRLAALGIPVWLVADAALPMLVSSAAAVWIGADAVTEHGVLNKVGSYVAALAAREHGVAVHAIATRRKLIPAGTASLAIAEMPAAELWDDPPAGVRPRNVYFEMVPHTLLRGVVVEDGVLGASEAAIAARDRALPAALAAALPKPE